MTWLALPRWLRTGIIAVGAAIALVVAFKLWLALFHDPAVIDRHEAKIAEQVAAIETEAAAAASQAEQLSRTETEQGNDRARAAAAGSPDPIKSGFDELRRSREAGKATR